ncbi:mboat family protein [Ophiostoma piceae UAMH 11346]|uniref:Mboat family protein n=1 Tax=Ophiostoma piceae (strain UAMH 11346) TaxID=1262450 RepID=S3D200_OPHP1|nr:mboat family protein [Ophiostoma piceae UAMH 11346]
MLPFINTPFVYIADRLGASPDELKLIFSLLLSYPLAGLLKRVPDARPEQKNLFIIGVSIFYLVGLFDLWSGLRTLFISSAVTYAIAKYLRTSPYMPWVGFVFLMGHMSVNQLIRQFANAPSSVDITGAQMVLVIKLSSFCWNVADGLVPDADLSPFQRDRVLRELPDLLDYAGYVLFFPSLLAGPACDFAEYRRWLDTTMFAVPANLDPAKRPPTRRKRKIPRSGTPAMKKMAVGLAWIGAFMAFGSRYPKEVLLSDEAGGTNFFRRVWLLYAVGLTTRMKYYGVWSLTEGACILTGLGFNGVDPATGRISWNRVANIDPWGVESAQNTRAYLENWNMKTNSWLRNYVYLRVTPRGKKPGFRASMATFVTSAFWHGFFPGYYLSFVLASFIQTVAKNCRRLFRPFFFSDPATLKKPLPSKAWLYDPLSWLSTQLIFSFAVAPFVLLNMHDSFLAWSRVYFYAVVAIGGFTALFASPVKRTLKKELERRIAASTAATGTDTDASAKKPIPAAVPLPVAAVEQRAAIIAAAASRFIDNTLDGNESEPDAADLPRTDKFAQTHEIMGSGLPADPAGEIDDMVNELREEVELQRQQRKATSGGATTTSAEKTSPKSALKRRA